MNSKQRRGQRKLLSRQTSALDRVGVLESQLKEMGREAIATSAQVSALQREAELRALEVRRESEGFWKDQVAAAKAEVERLKQALENEQAMRAHVIERLNFTAEACHAGNAKIEELQRHLDVANADLSTQKAEDVKALRKRLHAKTEKVAELEKACIERDKLIGALMRIPAVQKHMEEARAELAKREAAQAEAAAQPPVGVSP